MNQALLPRAALVFTLSAASAAAQGKVRLIPELRYPSTVHHATAFDRARGRAVLLSVRRDDDLNAIGAETWEQQGGSFVLASGESPRPSGLSFRMVYDERRGVTVLFPARGASGKEVAWEWDGATWTERDAPGAFIPTTTFDLVYHRKLERVVLVEHFYGQLRAFDGERWEPLSAQGAPPPQARCSCAAYDDERDQIAYFAGLGASAQNKALWLWRDGEGWQPSEPNVTPPARLCASMAFDEVRREIVMFGGAAQPSPGQVGQLLTDTWSWSGAKWKKLVPTGGPELFANPPVWDATSGAISLVEGALGSFSWATLVGSEWQRQPLSTLQPEGRSGGQLIADARDGSLFLFGGVTRRGAEVVFLGDTWRFHQDTWARIEGPAPDASSFSMAQLPGGGALGFDGEKTWRLRAGGWEQLSPESSPPPRKNASMGSDVDGSALLFGGRGEGGDLGDLWRWDGQGWVELSPQGDERPAPRAGAVIERHDALGKAALFGGSSQGILFSDTWLWDGKRWEKLDSPDVPQGSDDLSAAYSPRQGSLLLRSITDLWELHQGGWRRLPQASPSTPRFSALLRSPTSKDVLVFGGLGQSNEQDGSLQKISLEGEPCVEAGQCTSGACVDGVCCGQAQCGFCEACNVPGDEGRCAPLVANQKDPDSCPQDQACDGLGGCKKALGEACKAPSDCAGGAHCADGACCLEASCDGACRTCSGRADGLCFLVTEAINPGKCGGDLRCDVSGECKKAEAASCGIDAECASARCVQGRCVGREEAVCVEGNVALSAGGVSVPCGAYRCDGGACSQRCESTADCAEGAGCDADHRCVRREIRGASGAGCGLPPGPSGSLWWPLLLLAASLRRRTPAALALLALLAARPAEARPRARVSVLSPWYLHHRGAAAALDASTGGTFFFGGLDTLNLPTSDFWAWDGVAYLRLDGEAPGPRVPYGLVHDRKRDRLLLLGDSVTQRKDLWSWDRDRWRLLPNEQQPQIFSSNPLLWDTKGQRVLLVSTAVEGGQLFELSPEDRWSPLAAGAGPSARGSALLGYDEQRGVVVVAGGKKIDEASGQIVFLEDTWEWDGASWTNPRGDLKAPDVSVARFSSGLIYDPGRGALATCAEQLESSLSRRCVAWDGGSWKELPPLDEGSTSTPTLFHDPKRSTLAINSLRSDVRSTLFLTESGWQLAEAQPVPPPMFSPSGAHDPSLKRSVFFGGRTFAPLGDQASPITWIREQGAFRRLPPSAPSPPGYSWASMAFDPSNQGVLLFGGALYEGASSSSDTWLLKGDSWTKLSPAQHPSARDSCGMTTDPHNGRVLLFGGLSGVPLQLLNDTWSWDGDTWTQLFPDPPKPARLLPLFVYDDERKQAVLFGGQSSAQFILDDTWVFDGTTWERKTPLHSPQGVVAPSGYYDQILKRVILLGGLTSYSPVQKTQSIWAWDGVDWEELAHEPPEAPSSDGAAVFDPEARSAVALQPDGTKQQFSNLGPRSVRVVGNECASPEVCATPFCSEGVCCLEQDCGPCRSCALSGSEGECSPLARGSLDTRCPKGNACDGGRCVAQAGQPCLQGQDCLSGACVDGVCCARSACGPCQTCAAPGHQGECVPVLDAPDPDTCGGSSRCSFKGQCARADGQPCQLPDECASGVCTEGLCRAAAPPHCDGDHTLYSNEGTTDCGAFRCTPRGRCLDRCVSTDQCASGHRCVEEGKCVRDEVVLDESGCSVGLAGPASPWPWLGLLCLARRRRAP